MIEEEDFSLAGLRRLMAKQKDFLEQKSQVEELIVERRHLCLFPPKFYCELNMIEMMAGVNNLCAIILTEHHNF